MTRRARVFYIGMITSDAYGRAIGEQTYAGAAARKMILVVRALRSVGHRAIVVSLPFVGVGARRRSYGTVTTTEGGVPAVFLATLRSRYLRKLFGPFVLAGFAWRRVGRQDTAIVYNHAIEYLPALVLLRLKGARIVQDIEDAPTADETGARGVLNRLSFAVTSALTVRRKMVVADHVARELGLADYVVVRGVASHETDGLDPDATKWDDLRSGQALRIHYGGTLIGETGVDLFCAAVARLAKDADRLARPVCFAVTGVGELDKIRGLQGRMQGCVKVDVTLRPELVKADYLALLDSCHASLSLKRPGSGMANTTFPSKVIEITASGLALVSTRLGDVAEIFDAHSAIFLAGYEPADLADAIVEMACNPEMVGRVARVGQEVCVATFSPESVGHEMTRLCERKR
ncbi:glycosyltransferase [Acuticoccus kandeliae]|uniref:glycosyltransferase n=1 Tax=Acuticoccus kandeliae TaxID=2073160 RepID=UPI000D3E7FF8|nr:glycosyltransferase [Acuticoccus kandeliae]